MSDRRASLLRVRRMVGKELRQLLRDPMSVRMVFGAPIIQLLMFGYALNTDVREVSTFLVDHDRTPASRELAEAFTASGYFRLVGTSDRPEDMGRALDHGDATIGLEIPAGFASDVRAGRSPAVQLLVDGTNSNTGTVASGYAAKIVQERSARIMAANLSGAGGAAGPAMGIDLRTRAWFNPALESQVYNVPAVIGVIVLLMSLLLTAMAVVREREVGTLEQLLVSPLSAGELMLGKTIPVALIALVQITLVILVALFWFDVPFRGSFWTLYLAAALFILAGLSFGLFLSTMASTQQEAFLTMFLFLLPGIILSGFMYPVDTMPWIFQELTLLNPLRHFLEVIRAIFLKGSGVRELWPQFAFLTVMAVGGLLGATRRFRATL
ncbi:MAG TPA: ABC transporter permease [Longimicrobiales bacterium]|nr:ABC transporter permease [Longimicrobiales bacterium]